MVSILLPVLSIFQRTTLHNRRRTLALSVILTGLLVVFTNPVFAQPPAQLGDAVDIIENIIKLLAPAAAIAFLIMLIIGGFQFVTSGGDPKAAGAARTTLTYAVIGIVLVVAVWLILLVIKTVTGVNVTNVQIPPGP